MKVTIITLAGILAANLLAVAQDPTGITTVRTNQVHQPAVFPDTSRPQQLTATNQTNGGSSTNLTSSVTTSTNVSGTSTTGRQITIIRGSDTSTGSGQLPPNDNGIDPVKSTAGTPNDWRSGSSGPHIIPPRTSATNP
jgi:hypothetical protein